MSEQKRAAETNEKQQICEIGKIGTQKQDYIEKCLKFSCHACRFFFGNGPTKRSAASISFSLHGKCLFTSKTKNFKDCLIAHAENPSSLRHSSSEKYEKSSRISLKAFYGKSIKAAIWHHSRSPHIYVEMFTRRVEM